MQRRLFVVASDWRETEETKATQTGDGDLVARSWTQRVMGSGQGVKGVGSQKKKDSRPLFSHRSRLGRGLLDGRSMLSLRFVPHRFVLW